MRGITITWGDGSYDLRLKIKEIRELQLQTGTGLGEICRGVMSGWPNYVHLYELIRLALIGGGTPAVKAKQLVDMYVDNMPLAAPGDPSSPILVAQAVVEDLWFGPLGLADLSNESETDAGKGGETVMASTLPPSTDKARASGGRRRKSTK